MTDAGEDAVEEVKVGRGEDERWGAGVRAALLLLGAVAIALVFRKLQYSTQSVCCGDFDGYYHIKWSSLLWEGMRQGHFPPAFRWLPLTTLNPQHYVDHHLFFHFLQIPFTWGGDLRAGAKLAAWLYASLAVLSCYWLILRYRVRYALVWLVALLACSAPFLYRLNMAKAPPVAIIYMVLGIYLLFERRYLLLLPLAFLFVWTYSLFIALFGMALIWACVIGWSERRLEWRPVVWTVAGIVAGLVINPYFPKNLALFTEHVSIKLTISGFTTEVGQEWYPYESWYFLGSCAVAFVAMVVGYIAYDWSDRKRAARPLFLMILSTIMMIACFRSRRWVEYWPAFAVIFAAFSLKPLLEGARERVARLPAGIMDDLEPYLDRNEPPEVVRAERRGRLIEELEVAGLGILLGLTTYFFVLRPLVYPPQDLPRTFTLFTLKVIAAIVGGIVLYMAYAFWRRSVVKTLGVALVAVLVIVLNFNVRETRRSIEGDAEPDRYESSMAWVRENVPPDQMVFNTDWDDFPKMFYYDTRHAYASGLDPTYLLDRDKQLGRDPLLAELYKKITLGEEVSVGGESKEYGPLILEKFGARYVFSDNEDIHENFLAKALASGWYDEIHVYTFERKDGRQLTQQDMEALKQKAPPELAQWIPLPGGRRVVTGSTRDFICDDINGLCEQYVVNKDTDSTVLRLRDQKGQPPDEAQEEMGDEGEGDEGGDEEPINQ